MGKHFHIFCYHVFPDCKESERYSQIEELMNSMGTPKHGLKHVLRIFHNLYFFLAAIPVHFGLDFVAEVRISG